MQRKVRVAFQVLTVSVGVLAVALGIRAAPQDDQKQPLGASASKDDPAAVPANVDEARGRARVLHETIHATLQMIHVQYFQENKGLQLPARTMKAVFEEVARRRNVQIQWLVVDAEAMNVDHKPRDEFERQAVQAIASGRPEFELTENGVYRYAGAITLTSPCLRCHVPNRTSTRDRAAGLVIAMPIKRNG